MGEYLTFDDNFSLDKGADIANRGLGVANKIDSRVTMVIK